MTEQQKEDTRDARRVATVFLGNVGDPEKDYPVAVQELNPPFLLLLLQKVVFVEIFQVHH